MNSSSSSLWIVDNHAKSCQILFSKIPSPNWLQSLKGYSRALGHQTNYPLLYKYQTRQVPAELGWKWNLTKLAASWVTMKELAYHAGFSLDIVLLITPVKYWELASLSLSRNMAIYSTDNYAVGLSSTSVWFWSIQMKVCLIIFHYKNCYEQNIYYN